MDVDEQVKAFLQEIHGSEEQGGWEIQDDTSKGVRGEEEVRTVVSESSILSSSVEEVARVQGRECLYRETRKKSKPRVAHVKRQVLQKADHSAQNWANFRNENERTSRGENKESQILANSENIRRDDGGDNGVAEGDGHGFGDGDAEGREILHDGENAMKIKTDGNDPGDGDSLKLSVLNAMSHLTLQDPSSSPLPLSSSTTTTATTPNPTTSTTTTNFSSASTPTSSFTSSSIPPLSSSPPFASSSSSPFTSSLTPNTAEGSVKNSGTLTAQTSTVYLQKPKPIKFSIKKSSKMSKTGLSRKSSTTQRTTMDTTSHKPSRAFTADTAGSSAQTRVQTCETTPTAKATAASSEPIFFYAIVDTNCFLHQSGIKALEHFGAVREEYSSCQDVFMVLPNAVFTELDKFKMSRDATLATASRRATHFIVETLKSERARWLIPQAHSKTTKFYVEKELQGGRGDMRRPIPRKSVGPTQYAEAVHEGECAHFEREGEVDYLDGLRHGAPDDQILALAIDYSQRGTATLLTSDRVLQGRALVEGVRACSAEEYVSELCRRENVQRLIRSRAAGEEAIQQAIAQRGYGDPIRKEKW